MFKQECSQNSGGRERFRRIAFWKFAMMRLADVLKGFHQIREEGAVGFHFVADRNERD